jgi:uncharacterized protein (DUF1499 family)
MTWFPLGMMLLCLSIPVAMAKGVSAEESAVSGKRPLLCSNRPNCVSTMAAAESHAIEPYRFKKPLYKAKAVLKQIFNELPRTELVRDEVYHLHYEVRSFLFGFVDDVNFVFDEATKTIHFRSAARSGYYDFGVNRRRMEDVRKLLEGKL